MKLFKKINNNFVLAVDSNGEEVIVSGKGLGFLKMPIEVTDMSMITRTYYDIDHKYLGLINEIQEDIIGVSVKISDYAKRILKVSLNPNLVFTLADHIQFSIERTKKGNAFVFPLSYDFEQLYAQELTIAEYALRLIHQELQISLPESERVGIAMNVVNAESFSTTSNNENEVNQLSQEITKIIEHYFQIQIEKSSFNYSRFTTHLRYLFKRISEKEQLSSDNSKIFAALKKETPKTFECVNQIERYLRRKKNWQLDNEEKLYLILHVNRLITREDCNRKGITLDM